MNPVLYIFGGLPGTGKSTLSADLARRVNAAYIRIDTIEQSLRDSGISTDSPAGYIAGYALAQENLRLGLSVVADSVNPLHITRAAWRAVALQANISFVEIEIICSDPTEHRTRVETRTSTVPGLIVPTWKAVQEREYDAWDGDHLVIDTAGQSQEESIACLLDTLFSMSIIP